MKQRCRRGACETGSVVGAITGGTGQVTGGAGAGGVEEEGSRARSVAAPAVEGWADPRMRFARDARRAIGAADQAVEARTVGRVAGAHLVLSFRGSQCAPAPGADRTRPTVRVQEGGARRWVDAVKPGVAVLALTASRMARLAAASPVGVAPVGTARDTTTHRPMARFGIEDRPD